MKRRVFIIGIDCIIGRKKADGSEYYAIQEMQYEDAISHRKLSGADRISKLCIAEAQAALEASGLTDGWAAEECGLVLGTAYGSLDSIHKFDTISVEKGALFVNPVQFPNTVLNSPACQTGIQFGIGGPVYTLCNGIMSSLDAIGLAYCQIRSGMFPMALAGGVDEASEIHLKIHRTDRLLTEACGFAVLVGNQCQCQQKDVFEVSGYYTWCIATENIENASKELIGTIISQLQHTEKIQYSSIKISIYSPLSNKTVMEILKDTKEYFGAKLIIDIVPEDFAGVGGMVQIYDLIKELNCSGTEELNILLNMDNSKATLLFLSKNITFDKN